MRVVDLGGRLDTWEHLAARPAHVHLVNLEPLASDIPDWASFEVADACELSPSGAGDYDLVFSNSVIEHVGGHERRVRFAETVRSLAPSYWVQTPYRYFPVEPHWIAPGMQFLPVAVRTSVARRWPLGHSPAESRQAALDAVLWTELLDSTQLSYYFPDAVLTRERFLGLTKSLIAVRQA